MAVTVVSRPDQYNAAYLPIEYVFTSDKSPNSISAEISNAVTLLGESNSGDDVEVASTALPIVIGDYVLFENCGVYNGVHRVATIITGTAGINVTRFTIDTPVISSVISGNLLIPLVSGTASKYYNNFSLVLDLYVAGSFVVRLRKKHNADNEFIFDVSRVLQEYVGSDLLSLTETTGSVAVDLSKEFYIEYGEEYDEISNGIATLTLQTLTDDSSNTFEVVNATVPYVWMDDFSISSTTYSLADFYSTSSPITTTRWLTNQPSSIDIGSSESYQMSFIQGSIAVKDNLKRRVITYDINGSVIATTDTLITASAGSAVNNIACGVANLGAIITAATVKYDVLMVYGSSVISETKTFVINDDCSRVARRIEFVNKLGGIDAFTCKGKETKDMDIDKKIMKRVLNSPRSIPERTITTTGLSSKEVYTLNTGIVDKETKDWLIEMLESPEVYMVISSYRIPIQINTKFGFEKLQEGLYNTTFEYEFAFDRITQRN